MITLALCFICFLKLFIYFILFWGHKWRNPFQRENTTKSQGSTPTPKQTQKSALKTKTNWWLIAPLDLRPSSLAQIAWWGHHFFLGALLPQTWGSSFFVVPSFPLLLTVCFILWSLAGFHHFKSSFFLPSLGCLVISPRVCCHSSLP